MKFSIEDYKTLISQNNYVFPKNFLPFSVIDKEKYDILAKEHHENGLKIGDTFEALRLRTSKSYFQKIYPAQSAALNFSETSFPAYRFLMPDVLANDWLAIVDFHKKNCRDHALHQPLTAYVVFKLLGGGDPTKALKIGDSNLLDVSIDQIICPKKPQKMQYLRNYFLGIGGNESLFENSLVNRAIWRSLFYETAMVAAIFHDIGYPWQYINRLNKSLTSSHFSPENLSSDAKSIFELFSERMIIQPFHGYNMAQSRPHTWNSKLLSLIAQSLSGTHGFPGALGFLHLNDCIRKFPCEQDITIQNLCIEWASLGIMMHDMVGIYWGKDRNRNEPENEFLRLHFEKDPLSCIVALADVIEDFERPMVIFENNNDESLFRYNFSCISSEIIVARNNINIIYNFKNDDDKVANIVWKLKEEKNYFDPNYGYIDLSIIGINDITITCRN